MTMVVAELEKTLSSFPVVDSVVSLLDGVVEKLSALKRKVRSVHQNTATTLTNITIFSYFLCGTIIQTVAMDNQGRYSELDNLVLKR